MYVSAVTIDSSHWQQLRFDDAPSPTHMRASLERLEENTYLKSFSWAVKLGCY